MHKRISVRALKKSAQDITWILSTPFIFTAKICVFIYIITLLIKSDYDERGFIGMVEGRHYADVKPSLFHGCIRRREDGEVDNLVIEPHS